MTLVFGRPTYAQLEATLRTGDVLLYNDPETVFATRHTQRQQRRAGALARVLSFLPCVTYESLRVDACSIDDDEELEEKDSCRLDFESDTDDTRQAALVLLLVDDTHTNPNHDPTQVQPYVFVPNDRVIEPLRDFVEKLRGSEPHFALRRLLLVNEEQKECAFECARRTLLSERLNQHLP